MSRLPPPPPKTPPKPPSGKRSYKLEIVAENDSLEDGIRERLMKLASELTTTYPKLITKIEFSKNES